MTNCVLLQFLNRSDIIESRQFLGILLEQIFDPAENFDFGPLPPELDRFASEILHTTFQWRLTTDLLDEGLLAGIFAKYGPSRIFHMCNLHLTTNPGIRGPRKLYFCVMIHSPAQGHIVYEEKLHRSILQAQWNNAKRDEDVVNPSTLASIGKVGVEDTMDPVAIAGKL
ncbi:hypothetical protein FRB90_007539 [Tulasnella sp. 427]|nr:hypothetical protein FRB90_007539 [Tulasnella sp. 427]